MSDCLYQKIIKNVCLNGFKNCFDIYLIKLYTNLYMQLIYTSEMIN